MAMGRSTGRSFLAFVCNDGSGFFINAAAEEARRWGSWVQFWGALLVQTALFFEEISLIANRLYHPHSCARPIQIAMRGSTDRI